VNDRARCALCNSAQGEPVLHAGEARLDRCAECGLVRTAAGPAGTYDEGYYSAHHLSDGLQAAKLAGAAGLRARLMDRAYNAYLDPRSSRFRRVQMLPVRNRVGGVPPRSMTPGDLLDVGSGDGDFMFRARPHGWRVRGIEVNEAAVQSARDAGLEVHHGDLASAGFAPGSFDLVRLWHVLEHVPDPIGLLRQIAPLLRPEGVLIIGVPDFGSPVRRLSGARWSGLQPGFHLSHFDRHTLRRVVERAGFQVLSLRHRSVGTAYSTLGEVSPTLFRNPLAWGVLLMLDDLLDGVGAGDAFELLARPRRQIAGHRGGDN
jgi:SAM-dependent methyltransferase